MAPETAPAAAQNRNGPGVGGRRAKFGRSYPQRRTSIGAVGIKCRARLSPHRGTTQRSVWTLARPHGLHRVRRSHGHRVESSRSQAQFDRSCARPGRTRPKLPGIGQHRLEFDRIRPGVDRVRPTMLRDRQNQAKIRPTLTSSAPTCPEIARANRQSPVNSGPTSTRVGQVSAEFNRIRGELG